MTKRKPYGKNFSIGFSHLVLYYSHAKRWPSKSKIINCISKTLGKCFVCAKFTNLEKDLTKSGFGLYTVSPAGKRKGENKNVKRN